MIRGFAILLLLFASAFAAAGSDIAGFAVEMDGVVYSGTVNESELRSAASDFEMVRKTIAALDPARGGRLPYRLRVHFTGDPAILGTHDAILIDGPLTRFIVAKTSEGAARRKALRLFAGVMIDNALGPVAAPAWFRAGLLECLSDPRSEAKAFGQRRSPSVGSILETDHYSFNRQTEESSAAFIARSSAIVRYLLSQPRKTLGELFRQLDSGRPVLLVLTQLYALDESRMEKIASAPPVAVAFEPRPAIGPVSVIGTAERSLIEAEILLGLGAYDGAAKTLKAARRTPDSFAVGALIDEGLGMREQSERSIQTAIAADPRNFRAYWALAYLLVTRETTEFGLSSSFSVETAERAREALRKAIDLEPGEGDPRALLAFLESVRGENVIATIDVIKDALRIAPGNAWYRIRLAELQIANRQFNDARLMLIRLRKAAVDDRMRVYTENTLTRMNSLELQLASLKNRTNREIDGITDKPLSDEEIARRRERALNESLNAALRIPAPDEARVVGLIEKVECAPGTVVITVRADGKSLVLRNVTVENISLVSFVGTLVDREFGCGTSKPGSLAVVTYRPATSVVTSIEFVPQNFTFLAAPGF